VTVLAASEEPLFTSDNGVLTISTGACESFLPELPIQNIEDSSDNEESVSRSGSDVEDEPENTSFAFRKSTRTTMMATGLVTSFLAPRRAGVVVLLASFLASVQAQEESCKPTLELEISLPVGAEVASKFGETDHYLAATVDTVTWGYYDPAATPKVTMQSGETITVEVITHHSGHDYAKMIAGDPAVEDIFYWVSRLDTARQTYIEF
jgi:hypothetical protein